MGESEPRHQGTHQGTQEWSPARPPVEARDSSNGNGGTGLPADVSTPAGGSGRIELDTLLWRSWQKLAVRLDKGAQRLAERVEKRVEELSKVLATPTPSRPSLTVPQSSPSTLRRWPPRPPQEQSTPVSQERTGRRLRRLGYNRRSHSQEEGDQSDREQAESSGRSRGFGSGLGLQTRRSRYQDAGPMPGSGAGPGLGLGLGFGHGSGQHLGLRKASDERRGFGWRLRRQRPGQRRLRFARSFGPGFGRKS